MAISFSFIEETRKRSADQRNLSSRRAYIPLAVSWPGVRCVFSLVMPRGNPGEIVATRRQSAWSADPSLFLILRNYPEGTGSSNKNKKNGLQIGDRSAKLFRKAQKGDLLGSFEFLLKLLGVLQLVADLLGI